MADYEEGIYIQTLGIDEEHATLATLIKLGYPLEDGKPLSTIGITEALVHREIYAQYYETLEAGPQPANQNIFVFIPTNAKFLWLFYGKRSAATGDRTISNMDGLSRKPRFTAWKRVNNDKRHVYGIVIGSLDMVWAKNKLYASMIGPGMGHGTDSFTPTIGWLDAVDTAWTHITLMEWDNDALTPITFRFRGIQALVPIPSADGDENQEVFEFAPVVGNYTITCTAAQGELILADYAAKVAKTFEWTISKADDPTKEMAFIHTNCRISAITRQEVFGMEPIYTIVIAIEGASIAVKDGS